MTTPVDRPVITPEIIERFAAYKALPNNGAWGSLHIVLDDDNLENHCVVHCIKWAQEQGDTEGEALARILLSMTRSQRARIGQKVYKMEWDARHG